MELQQLKYFKTVAAIGKISEAAEALFISAPALSTSISRLEKELGVSLFDRTSNRITLNAQGQILLKYAEKIFADLDSAKDELRQSMQPKESHIHILTINSLIWSNLIASFTAEFPQYTLSCSASSVSDFAKNGFPSQYDFLLACQDQIPAAFEYKLESIPLFYARPAVILHKDHRLAQNSILDIRQLGDERIFLTQPNAPLYNRIKQLYDLHNIPMPADNTQTYVVRQKMVLENNGISFSTLPYNGDHPDIRCIPLADPFAPWHAHLYWRKDRPLSPEEITFRDFVQQLYHGLH